MCKNNLCSCNHICNHNKEVPNCKEKSRFYYFMKHVFRLNNNHRKLSKDYKEISEIIHRLYEHQEKQNDRQEFVLMPNKLGMTTMAVSNFTKEMLKSKNPYTQGANNVS